MKVAEFYVDLFWGDLKEGRELSPTLDDVINNWLEKKKNDVIIIDIKYCHSRESSSALVLYKECDDKVRVEKLDE